MKSLSSRTRMPRMTFSAIACGGWQMFRRRKPRANRSGLFVERFEMEPLERRVVLDGGSLDPAVATLLVDSSAALPTVSAAAQAGDFTYETADHRERSQPSRFCNFRHQTHRTYHKW